MKKNGPVIRRLTAARSTGCFAFRGDARFALDGKNRVRGGRKCDIMSVSGQERAQPAGLAILNAGRGKRMDYRRFGNDIVVRIDRGEEITDCLIQLCGREEIRLGSLSGLGAVRKAVLGIFDTGSRVYYKETYEGMYEIASLTGNITRKDGAPYLHLHAVIGNVHTGETHSGHLNEAVIGATGELFIRVVDGDAGRRFSDEIGLNLLEF